MKKKTIRYSISGIDYVYLKDVPVKQTRKGEVLALDLSLIETDIAREIVRQGIPIRGSEVRFLRKSLSLSLEKFGRYLGLSAPAILKWERARTKRLSPINEVALRAFMAEQLNIELKGRFTVLKGNTTTPSRLSLKIA
jgi:DNA-binding transcriptional regulator YiaG